MGSYYHSPLQHFPKSPLKATIKSSAYQYVPCPRSSALTTLPPHPYNSVSHMPLGIQNSCYFWHILSSILTQNLLISLLRKLFPHIFIWLAITFFFQLSFSNITFIDVSSLVIITEMVPLHSCPSLSILFLYSIYNYLTHKIYSILYRKLSVMEFGLFSQGRNLFCQYMENFLAPGGCLISIC